MKLSRSVRAQFCDYELGYLIDQCMKINWGFLRRRGKLISCCVSDEFENLPEQKPDWHCDERENWSLTESIIAILEKENALDPKFGNKNFDKAVPFSCFSTETGQDTIKEVHGASTVGVRILHSSLPQPSLVQ